MNFPYKTLAEVDVIMELPIEEIKEKYQKEGNAGIEFPELKINLRKEIVGDSIVDIVSFDGRISNSNSYDLNKDFHRLFSGIQGACVILDLSALQYVNSTGVAIFFSFFYRIRENSGRIMIGGFHPFLRRVFSLMDLPSDFKMFETLEDAITALK